MNLKRFLAVAFALLFSVAFAARVNAQSLVAGDVVGVVTDPSGAVVAGTVVTLTSQETGAVSNDTTTASGGFRFSLLKPGKYTLLVSASGFSKYEQPVSVAVGQATTANVTLSVSSGQTTIEIQSTVTPIISDNPSVNTTISQQEIEQLPNGGSDITAIAETAPGVVLNSMGGYGNFTVNGQPATSNLFTVNGENDMDPYFNISNSGATNLLLGANEIQEATVTSNAYSGEFGQLSGAQITYVTKSGTNQFHGNAVYSWNGRLLNANDWFSKNAGSTETPFSNANQWATSVGGPIIKNKTFFFVDYEGLRFVLPNNDIVTAPTPAFATAMLNNLATVQPNEVANYTTFFNLYQAAASKYASTVQPVTPSAGCQTGNLPGFAQGPNNACFETFNATPTALASEWILAGRVDQRIGANDNLFFRYRADHGNQPTALDAISDNFDAISSQPSWDAQINEVHTMGSNKTNAFTASLSHYVAQFQQSQPLAFNTFNYGVVTSPNDDVPLSGFNSMYSFPQGRNVTQYQFIDDFTWTKGRHNFKFGENFRRYDVSDHNFFFNYPGVYFGYTQSLDEFYNGLAYQYRQTSNIASNVPVALWGIGGYAQDEWNVKSNLKITLGLRVEHNSNPVCQTDCFADFNAPFTQLPSYQAGPNAGDVPYNADIATGLHQAFPKSDKLNFSPRLGFSWSAKPGLIVSGGAGIFYDNAPAGLVDDLLSNPPVAVQLRVRPAGGTPAFDPTATGSAATYQASATAFRSGFANGQTYTQISDGLASQGVVYAPPAFESFQFRIKSPVTYEYNLQIQKQIGTDYAVVVGYVGNHANNYPYTNAWPNANDGTYELYDGLVPFTSPVPNYGTVTTVQSGANSGYNGLNVSFKKNMSHGLAFQFNYTYSHTIDEVSNGGIFTYGADIPQGQLCPDSLKQCNYGNADYDIRHNFNGSFIYNPALHFENKILNYALGGWQWGGKVFLRSGLPFTIVDDNWNGAIINGGGTVLAQPLGGSVFSGSCGRGNATGNPGDSTPACLNSAAFVQSADPAFAGYTSFSNQGRNQYHGPSFFDMDMSLYKTFPIGDRFRLGIGATAYNVFNHPNFSNPDAGFGDSNFGQISSAVGVPTSPYGNFLGFDSAPRLVQLQAKITF
jgi:hypothetical protein